jgi:hypothetical protein
MQLEVVVRRRELEQLYTEYVHWPNQNPAMIGWNAPKSAKRDESSAQCLVQIRD